MGLRKKQDEAVEAPVEAETPVEQAHVVHHEDRRDSGTNWLEAEALPSLDDEDQQ